LALLVAVLGGLLVGLFTGILVIDLGLDQTVAGLGVMLTLYGLVYFIFRLLFGGVGTPPAIAQFGPLPVPLLSKLPVLGPVLFNQNILTYLAFSLAPVMAYFLFRTPAGLALRTVGENPQAAAAAGIKVRAIRYRALGFASAMAAAGGAFLTLAVFNSFTFGIVSARGWICLALVVLGRWSPWGCTAAVLLFGSIDALQLRLQSSGALAIPYQVFLMLPFLATIIAMIIIARRVHAPEALMKPYSSEDR
jgi:simple sugar transport system permease protein